MSGAARRRGKGKRDIPADVSDTSSHVGEQTKVPPGGFDGPASRGSQSGTGQSHGRRPSNTSTGSGPGSPPAPQGSFAPLSPPPGSRRSSVSGSASQAASQAGSHPVPTPRGDPARDRPSRYTDNLKNVDLPASFYNVDKLFSLPTEFKRRPGFNKTGKGVLLQVNAYAVTQFPTSSIFQYDVVIGNGDEKRVIQAKVWDSKARKEATGPSMIYDGNKLAWSLRDQAEIRLMVNLDEENGRRSQGTKNTFRLSIRQTKKLDVSIIQQFLNGKIQMGIPILEAVNFIDHLLREGPSLNPTLLSLRRAFFLRTGRKAELGGAIEVIQGIYQSLRLAEGAKLVVNLDVANCCFWKPTGLLSALQQNVRVSDLHEFTLKMAPETQTGGKLASAFHRHVQSLIKGINVKAFYKGNLAPDRLWKVFKISTENANEHQLEWRDPVTKKETGQKVSVAQYFMRKYNVRISNPKLPLVEMTKKGALFPIELLNIVEYQKYNTKLDETQTANMIKFAVSPPKERLYAIEKGKGWLEWSTDKFLNNYGMNIDHNPIKTNCRLLPSPGVKFGNKTEQPGTKGRWDLRGKTFFSSNPNELVSWGVGVFPGRGGFDKPALEKFCMDFARAYKTHGGKVANAPPHMMILPNDPGIAVEQLHNQTGNKFNRRPQLLMFIVQDKNAFHYHRIKKSCDCRYGVVSQVMQISHVSRGSPQYYSNVLMKVNAKLGGCTSRALPNAASGFKSFKGPTMFIGADVSHASPGSLQASMAAITVSFDQHAGRYAAACQTNGFRTEMISPANMRSMLGPLVTQWASAVGGGNVPGHVYYIRDGVAEGQFAQVMNEEVPNIKAVMSQAGKRPWEGKLTVIIAAKRHHIRAFPKPNDPSCGDPKGNPLPGCLIERDVTTPNEWDFFLFSHIALQGTSRPVHYTILYDDSGQTADTVPNMIYEHCYQYMRSTTSVSLHPAVYYAHLASNRAKAHEDISSTKGPQGGPGFKMNAHVSTETPPAESTPLLPMYHINGIAYAMWYI